MELSVFEKQYRELLADTDRRIEGVCGAMAPGGDGLVEPIRRIRDLLERQGAEVLEKGKLLQIGVMGQIKSGKSTFVNALLFGGKQVLPKGATPKTANPSASSPSPFTRPQKRSGSTSPERQISSQKSTTTQSAIISPVPT